MVMNVTSLTGNGLRDWLIQRISALYLGLYAIVISIFLLHHAPSTYAQWQAFMLVPWMRVVSLIAVVNLLLHTWIGIWTVTTDYLKGLGVRLTVQMLVLFILLGIFLWSIAILWGVTWL